MLASRAAAEIIIAPTSEEEQRLWNRSEEEAQVIEHSGFVLELPEVDAYLTGVVARLARVDGIDPSIFRVRVLQDASLNAFAFPTGRMYIHSGLLARILNEAQLAAVLGHEMTHVTNHHTLKGFRSVKTKTAVLAMVSSTAGEYTGLVDLLGGLGTMAAVSGYSRALEAEADRVGWERMEKCGYDTEEAPVVFRVLMADLSAHERKEPFFFGSHPRLADREQNFERLNAGRRKQGGPPGEKGTERFVAATLPVLLVNGELEMRAGHFDAARDELWRYRAASPNNVRVRWLIAENERLDRTDGDLAEAREVLAGAIALDPQFAQSYRTLGLICFHAGEHAAAAENLRRYLELEPGATDRAYLEAYLQQCEPAATPSPASP